MDETANLGLPYIMPAQAQKHVTHNEAIRALDAIVQIGVLDRDLATPPGSPSDGDRYIIAISASGNWSGKDNQIAAWQDNAWNFFLPREGWLVWVGDEDQLVCWDGASWITAGGSVNPTPLVGVNATADATNRLSINSPASLFNHEGGGHQQKINKATSGDTASQLYQAGFSGRAEIGLTGDDDFHVKVSSDGLSWKDAINVDRATGKIGFGVTTPGAAVHSLSTDGKAFLMTGKALDSSDDPLEGALIALSHNAPGNRQFAIADSQSGLGVRFLGLGIDGFNYLTQGREELNIGTTTHGVNVFHNLAVNGPVTSIEYMRPAAYTVATLPTAAASEAGAMIYVSDEVGGSVMAFFDGTNWRRMTDRAVVS